MFNNLPNFLNLIVNRKIKTAATIEDTDLIPLGTRDPNFLGGYQPTAITYQELASAIGGGTAVQSVTGLDTDNTDPLNPVVQISVDGTTVTGDGTPGNPLVSSGLPSWVETDATDKTIWCNGNGNIFQNCGFGESTLQSATASGNTAFGTSALSSTTSGGNAFVKFLT